MLATRRGLAGRSASTCGLLARLLDFAVSWPEVWTPVLEVPARKKIATCTVGLRVFGRYLHFGFYTTGFFGRYLHFGVRVFSVDTYLFLRQTHSATAHRRG